MGNNMVLWMCKNIIMSQKKHNWYSAAAFGGGAPFHRLTHISGWSCHRDPWSSLHGCDFTARQNTSTSTNLSRIQAQITTTNTYFRNRFSKQTLLFSVDLFAFIIPCLPLISKMCLIQFKMGRDMGLVLTQPIGPKPLNRPQTLRYPYVRWPVDH